MPLSMTLRSGASKRRRQQIDLSDLCMDIIILIFMWLPVKTLLKFRCVSQSWHSHISSPKFARDHLTFSKTRCYSASDALSHQRIAFCFDGGFLDHYPISSLLRKRRLDPSHGKKMIHPVSPDVAPRIVGSCDGLVCLFVDSEKTKQLVVWNLATRKCWYLPDFPVSSSHMKNCVFGFGYDDSSEDYRVVGIFTGSSHSSTVVEVYSFRTRQWKRLLDGMNIPYFGWPNEPTPFGNGKFYWVNSPENQTTSTLCYLELETGVSRSFKIPDYHRFPVYIHYSIALSEQNLVYVLSTRSVEANVWIFQEEGNKEPWTKVCTIDNCAVTLRNQMYFEKKCDLHVLHNGDIMWLGGRSEFMIYSPRDDTIRYAKVWSPCGIAACTYVESLISI